MTAGVTTPPPTGDQKPPRRRWHKRDLTFDRISFFLVFLVVPVIGYVIFVISPFLQAVYYSLTDWRGFDPQKNFVGLRNYTNLLSDDTFKRAVVNNILLAIVLPLVTVAIALFFASLVTVGGPSTGPVRGLRNSSLYRVVSFFPYVIPAIAIGLLWRAVLDPSSGLANGVLTKAGLSGFESFAWLAEKKTAMIVTMAVIIWSLVGFYMVLFIASIKGVPSEIYEAVRIDGAGRFRTAISVTLPMIRDNMQTSIIYMGILALDAFVYMAALNPGGGPDNSTLVITQHLFNTAFTKNQWGYACAMGVVLAIVTLLFAAIVFTINRLTGGTNEVAE